MTILTAKLVKPCKKCGGLESTSRKNDCKKCAAHRNKEWRNKNKQHVLGKRVLWEQNNRDSRLEYSKKYNHENKLKQSEYIKINRARLYKAAKEWYRNNIYSRCNVIRAIINLKVSLSFGINTADIPPELIEIKRLQMQLLHAIKERTKQLSQVN